jgi:predicted lipoprotein with Yx(FWY)xxD motif
VAACGPGGGGSIAPSAAASSEPSGSEGAGEIYTIGVTDDATLGAYLTGADGMTLYIFKNDSADTSTCADACAAKWPPLTVEPGESAEAGDGVTGELGTISRADGTTQVTYDHQPLYYFADDAAAGDTNGQGIGGAWFVAPVSDETPMPSASYSHGDY